MRDDLTPRMATACCFGISTDRRVRVSCSICMWARSTVYRRGGGGGGEEYLGISTSVSLSLISLSLSLLKPALEEERRKPLKEGKITHCTKETLQMRYVTRSL